MSVFTYYPSIVGLNGDFEAGKDDVAKVLVQSYGYTRVAFGDFVKDTCFQFASGKSYPADFPDDIVDIILALRNDPHAIIRKPTSEPVRNLLQFVGTDYYRAKNPQHWVEEFDNYSRPILASGGRVVAPDMRFDNEGEFVALCGGEEWGVVRPNLAPSPYRQHRSERSYTSTPQHVIQNDGSLGLLFCRVIDALQAAQLRHSGRAA